MMTVIARLRLWCLRTLLKACGFDMVSTHRICKQANEVRSATHRREKERAEIHMLAQGLGLVRRESREDYEKAIATFFDGKRSSDVLTDDEHTQFLRMLRAWTRAKAVMKDKAARGAA